MTKRHRRLVLAGVVIAAAAIGAFAFTQLRPVSVTVARPEQNVAMRVFGLGTVEARITSRIGFAVGATLTDLQADHGDLVRKGDVLARLDATEQGAKVAKAEALVLAARVGARKAEANIEKARAVLAQRQVANRRTQALAKRNVASEQAAEEAKRDEDVAAAELAVARSEVEVAKAQIADAQAGLDFERTLLDHHTLTAPYDAVVVERHKEAGTVIRAGDPIFTLLAPETVWILAHIDESRAGPIREGQAAEIRLRSMPQDTFQGHVARIGIESDRVSEERRVWVTCANCPPRMHLGEQAEVRVTVAELERAVLVPEQMVSDFDGRAGTAWIVRDGRLDQARMAFRHRSEDARLEVTGGLPDGSAVVTARVPGLRAGRPARIVESRTP